MKRLFGFKSSTCVTGYTKLLNFKGTFAFLRRNVYHERVIDYYERPRNVGSLDKNNLNVGTGLVGAPACGDVMKLQIQVKEGSEIIENARFKTFGCGSAIASSSLATEMIKGKTLDEALGIKNTDIAKHLFLPPVKMHCSMLAEDAIRAAIKDLKAKKKKNKNDDLIVLNCR